MDGDTEVLFPPEPYYLRAENAFDNRERIIKPEYVFDGSKLQTEEPRKPPEPRNLPVLRIRTNCQSEPPVPAWHTSGHGRASPATEKPVSAGRCLFDERKYDKDDLFVWRVMPPRAFDELLDDHQRIFNDPFPPLPKEYFEFLQEEFSRRMTTIQGQANQDNFILREEAETSHQASPAEPTAPHKPIAEISRGKDNTNAVAAQFSVVHADLISKAPVQQQFLELTEPHKPIAQISREEDNKNAVAAQFSVVHANLIGKAPVQQQFLELTQKPHPKYIKPPESVMPPVQQQFLALTQNPHPKYIEPPESVKHLKSAEPLNSVKPLESAEPLDYVRTLKPIRFLELTEPLDSVKTPETIRFLELTEPLDPVKPLEPAEPLVVVKQHSSLQAEELSAISASKVTPVKAQDAVAAASGAQLSSNGAVDMTGNTSISRTSRKRQKRRAKEAAKKAALAQASAQSPPSSSSHSNDQPGHLNNHADANADLYRDNNEFTTKKKGKERTGQYSAYPASLITSAIGHEPLPNPPSPSTISSATLDMEHSSSQEMDRKSDSSNREPLLDPRTDTPRPDELARLAQKQVECTKNAGDPPPSDHDLAAAVALLDLKTGKTQDQGSSAANGSAADETSASATAEIVAAGVPDFDFAAISDFDAMIEEERAVRLWFAFHDPSNLDRAYKYRMPRGEVRPFTTDEEEDLARQREAVKKYEEEAAEEYERHRLRARVTQRQEDLGQLPPHLLTFRDHYWQSREMVHDAGTRWPYENEPSSRHIQCRVTLIHRVHLIWMWDTTDGEVSRDLMLGFIDKMLGYDSATLQSWNSFIDDLRALPRMFYSITPKCKICNETRETLDKSVEACKICRIVFYCSVCRKEGLKKHTKKCSAERSASEHSQPTQQSSGYSKKLIKQGPDGEPLKTTRIFDTISYYHAIETAGDTSRLELIEAGYYLKHFSAQAVESILIDCFRLRQHDLTVLGIDHARRLYPEGHERDGHLIPKVAQEDFEEFLSLMEAKKSQMQPPGGWNVKRRKQCIRKTQDAPFKLTMNVGQAAVISRYRDLLMPKKLRLIATKIYGHALDRSCY